MTCPFCGAASNPRWVGGYLCGTIDGHQSGLCGSLVRYGERIVMVSEIDALKARIARLEAAGDSLKEEARPTMFDSDETRKRIMDAIDAWDAAREAKP
jgi:hypothetical protein